MEFGCAYASNPAAPQNILDSRRCNSNALNGQNIGAYHGVSPKHLQRYLNEFQFRFNQRWQEADLFSPVLQAAIDADPFPYRHLTAEPTG